jgi:hypothetical protein
MIWKKEQTEAKATEAKPQKVKKLSPKEIIGSQIEQLGPGQSLSYKLPEAYGGDFVIVELNPQYPGKGKKYAVNSDEVVEGKPAGKKIRMFDSDKPTDIANWIMMRNGKLFS